MQVPVRLQGVVDSRLAAWRSLPKPTARRYVVVSFSVMLLGNSKVGDKDQRYNFVFHATWVILEATIPDGGLG